MKNTTILSVALAALFGAAVIGCDDSTTGTSNAPGDKTVAAEKDVDVKGDGTVVTKEEKVTEKSDGSIVHEKSKDVDKPDGNSGDKDEDVDIKVDVDEK